jgi:hypothetical protein
MTSFASTLKFGRDNLLAQEVMAVFNIKSLVMPCISQVCRVKRKRDPHLQTLGRTFRFILEFRSVAPNSVLKVRSSGSNRNSLDKDMTRPVLGSSRLSVRLWPCLREMPSKANGRPGTT